MLIKLTSIRFISKLNSNKKDARLINLLIEFQQ